MSILDQVNRTAVSADLLGEVLELHAAMPAEDRPVFEVRAVRLFELLDRKGLREDRGCSPWRSTFGSRRLHGYSMTM